MSLTSNSVVIEKATYKLTLKGYLCTQTPQINLNNMQLMKKKRNTAVFL